MFERYTERARRVLFFARYEASQLGSINIETEHLLLGLTREGKGLTSTLFARANLSLQSIRQEIERRVGFREKLSTSVEIPFTVETKRVLQFAADEADRLLHNYIGTEHLLLGLLREERGVAATLLTGAGLTLQQVRSDIESMLSERAPSAPAVDERDLEGDPPFNGWWRLLNVPSEIVHVTLSVEPRPGGPGMSEGKRHWLAVNAPLRYLVARLHHISDDRVRLTDSDLERPVLDVALVLPPDRVDGEPSEALVLKALEEQLHVRITRETTSDGDVISVSPAQ
jgi:hypothetical protein